MAKTSHLDDYEPVVDRLAKWREKNPQGQVITEVFVETIGGDLLPPTGPDEQHMVITPRGVTGWLSKASLFDENDRLQATGWARQELLAEPPKKYNGEPNIYAPEYTSPVEVCETSAIGRALANAGYAAKRPSREEMSKAESARNFPSGQIKDENDPYDDPELREKDGHQLAWEEVSKVFPDDAVGYFERALKTFGITPGERRLTESEAKALIEELP